MMSDQTRVEQGSTSKRRGRRGSFWLGGIVASLLVFMLIGAIYEMSAEAADMRSYPAPGQMIDVGGYRLHINCTGTGSPTVVIDAGLSDWSTMWGFVQPGVAKMTRICTYDRAGMGWSESGPLPRNAARFAKELHTLLHNATIPEPYVLVGHSLGGLTVRVFVHDYPAEVAGVALIESMNPGQFPQLSTAPQPQSDMSSHAFSFQAVLARFGVARLLVKPLGFIPYVPPDEKAYFALFVRPQYIQTFTDESRGMPEGGKQAAAVKTFGDLPLIVLTSRLNHAPNWQGRQTELLQLSSNSHQMFAEKGGHNIEIDQPEAAVTAIVKMVKQVRQGTKQ